MATGEVMKPTLEDLRLSAEACGRSIREFNNEIEALYPGHVRYWQRWNPPENPAQNWECVEELLRRGYGVEYQQMELHRLRKNDDYEYFNCDAKDFACLALAELKRREK